MVLSVFTKRLVRRMKLLVSYFIFCMLMLPFLLCNHRPLKATVGLPASPRCQNPLAAASVKTPAHCPCIPEVAAGVWAAPVAGRGEAPCRAVVPEADKPMAWVSAAWDPPPGCGEKCRPVVECSGYTWISPALQIGAVPNIQGRGGDLGHFCGAHGPFQPIDPLDAEIASQRP